MEIKAVIFDLDGTLIDSMGVWLSVDKEYLAKRDINPPENLFDDVESGNSFIEIAQYFKDKFDLPDSVEEIMSEWIEMVEDHYQNRIKIKDGVEEFLISLQENEIKMAIGTSNELELSQKVLKSNSIYHFFDTIVSGCKGIKGKPHPDIFLEAAKQINVEPRYCLVIEDTLVGVEAAKNAGMQVFAINDPNSEGEQKYIIEKSDFFAENFKQIKLEFFRRFNSVGRSCSS